MNFSLLSTLTSPLKALGALSSAAKEAWGAKDKGFTEKVMIFFSTFKKEMGLISKEKANATKETNAAVGKSVEETIEDAKEAFGLEKSVQGEKRDEIDKLLSMVVRSEKSLDTKHQGYAVTGWKKLEEQKDGKSPDVMTVDEATTISAIGLMTLSKPKNDGRYKTEADYKKYFKELYSTSDKSKLPMKKLLSMGTFEVFKIPLGWLHPINSGKLYLKLPIDAGDIDVLSSFKDKNMENEKKVIDSLHNKVFDSINRRYCA